MLILRRGEVFSRGGRPAALSLFFETGPPCLPRRTGSFSRDLHRFRHSFLSVNSTKAEPNLLLEVDHIVPISKGGLTIEDNLQTLCWKCNRSKGAKLFSAI